jgi:hypothetical protein
MARAKPGSGASPVNGDEARGTWFFRRESLCGYDAPAVRSGRLRPGIAGLGLQTGPP